MRAALVEGLKVGQFNVSLKVASETGDIAVAKLREVAARPAIERRIRKSTAAFHALKVNQRPAFEIESEIGDRAVVSGLVVAGPLIATIEAMLNDVMAYRSHRAHFGTAPKS